MIKFKHIILGAIFILGFLFSGYSQDTTSRWDNLLWLGNKVAWAKDQWNVSGELQIRLENNAQSLDQWFFEVFPTYQVNKNLSFSIPMRFAVTSEFFEFRPGVSAVLKMYPWERTQINHQVMWQVDIDPNQTKHGLRYAVFFNVVTKNKKWIPNAALGIFYRWRDEYLGLEFIRVGAGVTYVLDVKHKLNFGYYTGVAYSAEGSSFIGVPLVQLLINITKDYKYVPANYINF